MQKRQKNTNRLLCQCPELIAFSPTTEPINVNRKNIRQKVTGSLNRKNPMRTVPIAPIPVQTA